MSNQVVFDGFFKDTVSFFNRLKKHNEKEWFQSHRGDYESYVLTPARSFVAAMGERLTEI
jgi:uncharacterized protein (DUF2461 family)